MKRSVSILLVLTILASLLTALPLTALAAADMPAQSYDGGNCPSEDAQGRNNGRHHWVLGDFTQPWCIEPGYAYYNCIYCDEFQTQQYTPALGHDFHDDWYTMNSPTCTEPGMSIRYCHRCQQEEVRTVPAIGHNWDSGTVTVQPTCTDPGERVVKCTNTFATHACGATRTEVIPPLGHNWGPWREEYPGTCVKKGMNYRKCQRCGVSEYVYSDYGDHDWGPWTVVTPAAPGVPGLERRVCRIEASHVEEREIPPLSVNAGLTAAWLYDGDINYMPYPDGKDTFQYDDTVVGVRSIKNTGDVPLAVVKHFVSEGETFAYYQGNLEPGEEMTEKYGFLHIGDTIDPGTETAELLGTATISVYYVGYDPAGFSFDWNTRETVGTEICTSNTVSRTYKIVKEEKAKLTIHLDARDYDDISVPKTEFCEGESVFFYGEVENTGEVPLEIYDYDFTYTPGDTTYGQNIGGLRKVLNPGEKTAYVGDATWFISAGYPFNGLHLEQIKKSGPETETLIGTLTYAVKVRGYEPGTNNVLCDAEQDCTVGLLKSAPEPALTLTWVSDSDADYNVYPGVEHQPDDAVWVDFELENNGNVLLLPYCHAEYGNGNVTGANDAELPSGESRKGDWGTTPVVSNFITPGTETAELLGTVTITIWYDGLDPDTGEKLCESNRITREWRIVKEGAGDEVHPAISVYIWADPGVGDGKRYEGAKVPYHYEVTNTGDCPVYVPWWPDTMPNVFDASAPNGHAEVPGMWALGDEALLNPGETYSDQETCTVYSYDAEKGYRLLFCWGCAWYYDTDGEIQYINADSNDLKIDLTYAEPPEPAKPALEIKWTHDDIYDASADLWYSTTAPGVLEAEDEAWAEFDVTNVGNVPLKVITYAVWANGKPDDYAPWSLGIFAPGESDGDEYGAEPLGGWITSGTDTAELQGTVTVTFWAKGFDPDTDEQLCETEHLSRTWQVGKPGPGTWPIPEESKLTVSISENSARAIPEGYRLTENWDTDIVVRNEGPVDVDAYTLHVDFEADYEYVHNNHMSDGASWYEWTHSGGIAALTIQDLYSVSPAGEITLTDVGQGYVRAIAYVTWTDPDSGNPRESNHASVYLPVVSQTGLLLKKGIEKGPANGEYFQEGEPILWTLTVTNISNEPIGNVVVMDQGVVVGAFTEILAGKSVECEVPPHIVTDYEAEIVGTVTNIATATGDDVQGISHTWPSNPVGVPTNEESPTPIPPWPGPKDPTDPPEKTIDPPEPPDKDKKKDEDELKGDGGDACELVLIALGDSEIRYELHACAEHQSAAQAAANAQAADRANGAQAAAAIWREEIDKLYQALSDQAKSEDTRAVVLAEQEAFRAYADACAALYPDQAALCDMLRLWCTELCCIVHTAPEALPGSLLHEHASLMNTMPAEECQRAIVRDSVTLRFDAEHSEALRQATALVLGNAKYAGDAFTQAQYHWQSALDGIVNQTYKAADRDSRKLIAAWRQGLDRLISARTALFTILYDDPSVAAEAKLNLYRDALLDACGNK